MESNIELLSTALDLANEFASQEEFVLTDASFYRPFRPDDIAP